MGARGAVPRPLTFGRRVSLSLSHGCSVDPSALFFTERGSHRKINGHFGMDYVRGEGSPDPGPSTFIYFVCIVAGRYGAINRYSLRRRGAVYGR